MMAEQAHTCTQQACLTPVTQGGREEQREKKSKAKRERGGLDLFKGIKVGEFQGPSAVSRQSQCRLQTSDN